MSKVQLNTYGLHKDEESNITWLIQDKPQNVLSLPDKDCPFQVPKRMKCPHNIDLNKAGIDESALELVKRIWNDPLFNLISPVPYEPEVKCVYIEAPKLLQVAAINYLQMMSTPTCVAHTPSRSTKIAKVQKTLQGSNIARYLISGISADDIEDIHFYISNCLGLEGRLLLCGEKIPRYGLRTNVEFLKIEDSFVDTILEFAKRSDISFNTVGNFLMKQYLKGQMNG